MIRVLEQLGERAIHVIELPRGMCGEPSVHLGARARGTGGLIVAEPTAIALHIGGRRGELRDLALQSCALREQLSLELFYISMCHRPVPTKRKTALAPPIISRATYTMS